MSKETNKLEVTQIFKSIFVLALLFVLPGFRLTILGWIHFFAPLAVFVYLVKFGWNVGNKLIVVSFLFALIADTILGTLYSTFFTITLIPLGYVLAHAAQNKDTPVLAGTKGVIVQSCSWTLYGLIISAIHNESLYKEIINSFIEGINGALAHYKVNESIPAETIYAAEQSFYQIKTILPIILPSFFVSCIIVTVCLTMVAGSRILQKLSVESPWIPYRYWQIPDKLIWLVISAALFTFFDAEPTRTIGINLLIIFAVIYCLQGFSIFVYFINKWKMPRFFKTVLFITVIFQSFGTALLLTLGLSNVWLDYRKLGKKVDHDDKEI